MSTDRPLRALAFGGVAEAYHRGRPSYPADAVAWLAGSAPSRVLELGAGTGKLTAGLVAAGHDVHATEPDAQMRAVLARELPDVRTSAAVAEALPAADASVDVVVAAQCYHWFDPAVALPEIARALRPGGTFAVVWNERDGRIPWVRKLGRLIGVPEQPRDPTEDLAASGLFDDVETADFVCWQRIDRGTILDLARSRSNVALMDEAERERLLADLLALYDEYGRGMDGMQLPYRTTCFRARVAPRPDVEPLDGSAEEVDGDSSISHSGSTGGRGTSAAVTDSATTLPRVALQPDDGSLLLIDLR